MTRERVAIFKEWANLDGKKRTLTGYKVSQILKSFRDTHYTLNRNYHELSSAINSYEADTTLWDTQRHEELLSFFMEFSRLLHNYLSSTYTLVTQGRESVGKHGKLRKLNNFYWQKISSVKANDIYCFCKCLRHITQHFELVELIGHFSRRGVEIGQPAKQSIVLEKESLSDIGNELWTDEKEGFRRYIDNHNEIDLKLILNQYQELLNDYYDQFCLKTKEQYAEELKENNAIEKQIGELQAELKKANS